MTKVYAAIDIGANAIKLKIIEYSNGEMLTLENINTYVSIGDDVYRFGYIEHETVKTIIKTLNYFKQTIEAYKVKKIRAVGTSSLREASNARNVVEVIKLKTGIDVEIIEDSIEKFLTYKAIRDNVKNYTLLRKSSLLVEINSGSSSISIYHKNKLLKNDEIRLGTKNLKMVIEELENKTVDYPIILEELLDTQVSHMSQNIQSKKLDQFVCLGGESRFLKELLKIENGVIRKEEFKNLYNEIISDHRRIRYKIEEGNDNWYEFLVSILMFKIFLEMTNAKSLVILDISLRDGILADFIEHDYELNRYNSFNNDILSQAIEISKRYRSSEKHIKCLEKHSIDIYKELKEHYLFNERDELLLRLSSILHEIGKYTRMKDYLVTSYDKISNLSIIGVSEEEIMIVAHICRLISSSQTKVFDMKLDGISEANYGTVFKLSSIMSLADALDKGKSQKIKIEKVSISEDYMTIYISHDSNIILEEFSFQFAIPNFINTFGVIPELKEI